MTQIKPLFDRVLIEPLKAEEKTSSGLIIPDSAQNPPQEAIVIAVGEGKRNPKGDLNPMGVEVGDRVIYSQYTGTKVEYDGKTYILMNVADLFAVVS
jgi:chaperonin GroES